MSDPLIGVVMGSQSDWPTMKEAAEILSALGVLAQACVQR